MIHRAVRHPAVHILLLGVVVAVAILVAKGPPTGDETRRVTITQADLRQLSASFQRTWQREPTPSELRGELEGLIRQEVLYQEALVRGYDRDDPVVRVAMQRKMEFLASSQALRQPPTDQEVEAFFALRRERYRVPAVLDFAQVFVSPDVRGNAADQVAAELLGRLREEDPDTQGLSEWGDRIMLNSVYRAQTERDISTLFGAEFAPSMLEAEPGGWVGPIRSGYGLHLVKVLRRRDGRIPELTEVVQRVLNDMEYEAGQAAREQLYQEIAQSYQIVLDPPVRALLDASGDESALDALDTAIRLETAAHRKRLWVKELLGRALDADRRDLARGHECHGPAGAGGSNR